MAFQAVKGTRDFYPEDMAIRNWITEAWRRVSIRNGFVEFDGPVLEYLDLYRVKSGEEIVSQLFNLTDRAGRQLAMRPEITPTLARMVNAKINSLPRPIKWFSVPRLFRAENPQKGRLREFFQWNIDIIGGEEGISDAECVFTAIDALQELGLTAGEAQVRYSSRKLLSEVLKAAGLSAESVPGMLAVLDKRSKVPAEAFAEMLAGAVTDEAIRPKVLAFLEGSSGTGDLPQELQSLKNEPIEQALAELKTFQKALDAFGIADWCKYDVNVVRGLAYYTGIVYEVFDAAQSLRAVAGGGRYDNLLEVLGGPKVGATGLGMGDAVLGILLEEKGKRPVLTNRLDAFVISGLEGQDASAVLSLAAKLRRGGIICDYSARSANVGKLLKEANRRQARYAVILSGPSAGLKDLGTGQQVDVNVAELVSDPRRFLV